MGIPRSLHTSSTPAPSAVQRSLSSSDWRKAGSRWLSVRKFKLGVERNSGDASKPPGGSGIPRQTCRSRRRERRGRNILFLKSHPRRWLQSKQSPLSSNLCQDRRNVPKEDASKGCTDLLSPDQHAASNPFHFSKNYDLDHEKNQHKATRDPEGVTAFNARHTTHIYAEEASDE